MKWNKLTIETTTAAEDMLSYELSEMGMEGVEIEDHVPLSEEDRKIMYVDLLPDEIAPDDGKARISCYVDEKEDLQAVIAKIKAKIEELSAFMPMGTGKITFDVTEEEDWINNWKVFFKPFRLDDNIVIKPTWETLTDQKEDDIVIEIDPGAKNLYLPPVRPLLNDSPLVDNCGNPCVRAPCNVPTGLNCP